MSDTYIPAGTYEYLGDGRDFIEHENSAINGKPEHYLEGLIEDYLCDRGHKVYIRHSSGTEDLITYTQVGFNVSNSFFSGGGWREQEKKPMELFANGYVIPRFSGDKKQLEHHYMSNDKITHTVMVDANELLRYEFHVSYDKLIHSVITTPTGLLLHVMNVALGGGGTCPFDFIGRGICIDGHNFKKI